MERFFPQHLSQRKSGKEQNIAQENIVQEKSNRLRLDTLKDSPKKN